MAKKNKTQSTGTTQNKSLAKNKTADDIKLPLTSMNVIEDRITQLEDVFPEAVTEGKVDFEKLKSALGEKIENGPERYGLTWAGKREAFHNIQTLSTGTLRPVPEESVNFDTTENLIIEGDNLEVLKLLQKSYYGKIKMIYIDPPYNTGNEFIYPDDFREGLQTYLRYTKQVSEGGIAQTTNKETSGRYHSIWLNMMYPRLYLVKNLLKDDGVIFISIDDNEISNLRSIMDEIFGEENFIANIIWQKVFSPKNTAMYFSEDHDYVLVYARNKNLWRPELLPRKDESVSRYTNPDNDPRGPWLSGALQARNYYSKGMYEVISPSGKKFKNPKGTYWRFSKEKFLELEKDNRIWWGENGDNVPRLKRFLSEVKQGVVPQTLWTYKEVGHTQEAKEELLEYVNFTESENVLNSVKPSRLIQRMLQIGTDADSNDIVLDFFAGSGPTGHAVVNQNLQDGGDRRFILVQLPEPLPKLEDKLKTIADMCKMRVISVINKLNIKDKQSELDLTDIEKAQSVDLGVKVTAVPVTDIKKA